MSRLDDGISALVSYGIECGLLPKYEENYAVNMLLDIYNKDSYEPSADIAYTDLESILSLLIDEASGLGLIDGESVTERDLWDTRLMNALTPRPAQVVAEFERLRSDSPAKATDYFYKLSQDTDYIRRYRICKDVRWSTHSAYGDIDMSINLSKPEKDPKAIAAAGQAAPSSYPKCQLCMENMGYAGRMNHPARETHRIVPLQLAGEDWGFQYSPYVYYNEHCIVLCQEHRPMKISRDTFSRMFDFVRQFPHYFIGSNADLPIVGGSILSHDHYQGGHYTFAMEKAEIEREFTVAGYEDISVGIVRWPLSVIRISGTDAERLADLADHILQKWRGYSDEAAYIYAETDGEKHNTITPIARRRGELYEMDLCLRNNITTAEHPDGLYHPHKQYHHIKKENIGLIEVMGLAILPARLKSEMEMLEEYILAGKDYRQADELIKHADWADEICANNEITAENIHEIIYDAIGQTFVKVLEDAGVYKCTDEGRAAFGRFMEEVGVLTL